MIKINYILLKNNNELSYSEYDFSTYRSFIKQKNINSYNLMFSRESVEFLEYERKSSIERFKLYLVFKIYEYEIKDETKSIFIKENYPNGESQIFSPNDNRFLNMLSVFKRKGLI